MSDAGHCPLTRKLTDDVETDPPDVLIESAPNFANWFLAYLKLDEEGRSCVNEMCSLLDRDERVPQSQRDMAVETIVEALFPEPSSAEHG